MFGFFKKQEYVVPEIFQEPQEPEVNIYESAPYTVGVNKHGLTQVVFRTNFGTSTLSMEPQSVRHFIKMLECTLEKSDPTETENNLNGDTYD